MTRFGTTRPASLKGTLGRGLAVGAMVLGGLTAAISPAAAQDTAFAATIGDGAWNTAWDSADWERDDDRAEEFGADLVLSGNGAGIWFYTVEDVSDGPTCYEDISPIFEDSIGVSESEPLEGEDGEQIGFSDDANARGIHSIAIGEGRDAALGFGYYSCWTIEEGATAIFAGSVIDQDALEDSAELVDAVYAAVGTQFDGETVVEDGMAAEGGTTRDPEDEPSDDPEDEPSDDPQDDPAPSEDIPAGADADNGTYRSPEFGFTASWDPSDWDVTLEVLGEEANGRDLIRLDETDDTSALFVEGGTNWDGDLVTCMESLASDIALDLDDTELLEDPETGEPFEIIGDDQAGAAFLFDFTGEGADPNTVVVLACQALEDDVVVGVTHISDEIDDYFGEDYPLFEDIFDSIGSGEAGGDTPDPSERGDRDNGGDTPDSTPDAGEVNVEDLDGAYISPTYFYFMTWDTDMWWGLNMASDDGTDSLSLMSEDLQADLVGYEDGAGDVVGCIEDLTSNLDDAYGDAVIFERESGDLITVDEAGTQAFALITYTADGVTNGTIVTCHQISGDAVVSLAVSGPVDLLVDQTDDVTALLAGLLVIPAE